MSYTRISSTVTSRLDPPSHVQSMVSHRFVTPWLGEPKWTPYPHPSPTPLHISLPTPSTHTYSISPLFYTHIHSPPTFLPIQIPPFIFYTTPAPYPPFSLFFTILAHPPPPSTLLPHFT